jgi:hypothetical protein
MSETNYKYWDVQQPNWHKIDDINAFDLKEIKKFHPDDPRYIDYWRNEKKRCIEGIWRKQFGKWMHMPGCLYFYGKFGIIIDTDKFTKKTKKIRPYIHDLEWEQAFYYWEARGFSGWADDDVYTSSDLWFELNKLGIPSAKEMEDLDPSYKAAILKLVNKDGELKKYKDPRENLRSLKDKPLGRPLFENNSRNTITLGSRGGGKSYFEAIAKHLYNLCFDGRTEYKVEDLKKDKLQITCCIGSADTEKSGELVSKVVDGMAQFATNQDLGVWGEEGSNDWTPIPFYRDMSGNTHAGNKKTKGWRHYYSKKINGKWVDGFGSGTSLFHVSYATNKKASAEAAAGGRYNVTTVEEMGITGNVIEVWNSNEATVKRNGIPFGVQSLLGTSGNVELILPTKEMFNDPKQFRVVSFKNLWEDPESDIGFFLPAYMTFRQFKDKNGNTNIQKAREYWLRGYEDAAEAANPKTLRMYCMNFPDIPSHMWVSDRQYLLPYEEAQAREKELLQGKLYQKGICISLRWDSSKLNGVDWDVDEKADPFYEFPLRQDKETIDGAIIMYRQPEKVRGVVPNDMYFFTHDPYVSDEQDEGGSLGVTHVWMNPKYSATHEAGQLVATYIGKPKGGKKEYYNNLEKLLAFYGNPFRGLAYEANRGEYCRSYFEKRNKLHLLALRPQHAKGDSIYERQVTQFGYLVGARGSIGKRAMVDDTADWLLQDVPTGEGFKKLIETLPCIFSVRQIMHFTMDGNFDAVSSILLAPVYISEQESLLIKESKEKEKNNLQFLSNKFNNGGNNKRKKGTISRIA